MPTFLSFRATVRHLVLREGNAPPYPAFQADALLLSYQSVTVTGVEPASVGLRTPLHILCATRLYGHLDSNQELFVYKTKVLPFNYTHVHNKGIEPLQSVCNTDVLPLN